MTDESLVPSATIDVCLINDVAMVTISEVFDDMKWIVFQNYPKTRDLAWNHQSFKYGWEKQ